ncbi:substrate-binding periplasmic protein [Aestuariispira insulae]|uniref:ABC-type amino acid transport substrate-binding protein n=1 Tax=Aestuariispira insulae TaxID=1461337 RepID=A0A3D9HQ68_9PROT|nr:transporter substrate-binding domain-containing protein [Aestuariispira insulae]RED51451.1 ABC-type amino acid transport substrate-binding protein [Aestuariispira insulae]
MPLLIQKGVRWLIIISALVQICGHGITARAEPIQLATGDYEPFTGPDLENGGVLTEIVQTVFEAMGRDSTVSFYPWQRAITTTQEGAFHATFPFLKNKEREQKFLFSDPIVSWESKIFIRKDTDIRYQNPESLTGLAECLPHHTAGIAEMDRLFNAGKITRMRPPSMKSCWLMIAHGRADFLIEDIFVARIAQRSYLGDKEGEVVPLDAVISIDPGYLMFPKSLKNSVFLRDLFNTTLNTPAVVSQIQAIRERHILRLAKPASS